ncbi:MAG: hypothetical protein DRK00_09695, partial [Thermoprotei archaeon]
MRGARVVFKSPGEVCLEEYEVRGPGEGEVLVETLYTVISPGTETAFLLGLPNTPRRYPMYPGYSNVGIVVSGQGFSKGELVASPSPHASHVLVRPEDVVKVPDGVRPDHATFFNLISIALQGVRRAQLEIGESVVVLGLGVVGQLALQLSMLSGAMPVIGVDLYDYRCRVARELGADYAVNPLREDVVKVVKSATGGRGADVVIEATGNPEAIPLALRLAAEYGRVIILGSPRGATREVDFYTYVHRKGLMVIGAHNSLRPRVDSCKGWRTAREDWELALKLLSRGRINVGKLISARLSYREAARAY